MVTYNCRAVVAPLLSVTLIVCGFDGPSAGGVAPHPLVMVPLAPLPPVPVAPPVLVEPPPVPVFAPPVPLEALPPVPDDEPPLLLPQPPTASATKPVTTNGTSTRRTRMGTSCPAIRKQTVWRCSAGLSIAAGREAQFAFWYTRT